MGIKADLEKELTVFPIIREGKQTAFHHVFIAYSDSEILPDKNEISEVKKVSLGDLKSEVKRHPEQYFDAFLTAFDALLKTL